jgi:hypothetical protein
MTNAPSVAAAVAAHAHGAQRDGTVVREASLFTTRDDVWRAAAHHRASQRVVMVGVNDASDAGASDVDVDVDDGFEVLALGLGA